MEKTITINEEMARRESLTRNERPIMSGDDDVLERLEEKLEKEKLAHEEMKKANEYYRVYATLDLCPVSETCFNAGVKNIKDQHKKPFPSYCLSKSNASMKRIKERIEQLKTQLERCETCAR